MEFLGVGVLELLVVLVLALIVAGPKRMIVWSYTLGRWIGTIRRLWGQTATALQQELDAAGLDVQVPKDIPTRGDLQREVGRVVNKYGAPIREPLNEVKSELESVTRTAASVGDELADNAAKAQSAITGLKSARPTKPITPAEPRPVQVGGQPSSGHKLADMGRTSPDTAPAAPAASAASAASAAPAASASQLGTWAGDAAPPPADTPTDPPTFGTWSR